MILGTKQKGMDVRVIHDDKKVCLSFVHCGENHKDLSVTLSLQQAIDLSAAILNGIPADYDRSGFREKLIGRSFSRIWNEPKRKTLVILAGEHLLEWDEILECEQGSSAAAFARNKQQDRCLWIEHKNNIITDVIWS